MINKWILIALGCTLPFTGFAQDKKILQGKIVADALLESSVHIINKNYQTGTVNTASGSFLVEVRVNDTLLFSSLQYRNLEIPITTETFLKGFITVALTEDVNILEEVNVSNIELTGILGADLEKIEIEEDLPFTLNYTHVKSSRFESDINDHQEAPVDMASRQYQVDYGAEGLNILGGLGLLADLAGIKRRPVQVKIPSAGPVSQRLRNLFDDDFFTASLGISKEKIGDFVFYLDDVGLSEQLFGSDKRLALIELLIDHGKVFNAR